MQQVATMYRNFIIPYLYEAQHVSGDTPPTGSLLFFMRGRLLDCSWWTLLGTVPRHLPNNVHQLHVQQPSTYAKPEAASAVLGS